MGLTHVSLKLSNPQNRKITKEVRFLVDSGAFYSFVDSEVLKGLKIKPETTKEFILANGKVVKRKIGIARFHYGRNVGGAPVVFAHATDENLLGATTLEALGLMLNPFDRTILPITLTA